jgi:hypothetical protein
MYLNVFFSRKYTNRENTTMQKTSGDYYRYSNPWYYVIQFYLVVYALTTLAYIVLIMLTGVEHTYFPGTLLNVLHSDRYTSTTYWAIFLASTHVLMVPFALMMITYRRSYGCSIFWFSLIFMLGVCDFYVFIVLGKDYQTCNNYDARGNICNDKAWCCAPQVNALGSNACPISPGGTCASHPIASLSELSPDIDFVWLFATNVAYLAADILVIVFFLVVSFCAPSSFRQQQSNVSEYDEVPFEAQKPTAPPLEETKGALPLGLVQRMQSTLRHSKPE